MIEIEMDKIEIKVEATNNNVKNYCLLPIVSTWEQRKDTDVHWKSTMC